MNLRNQQSCHALMINIYMDNNGYDGLALGY